MRSGHAPGRTEHRQRGEGSPLSGDQVDGEAPEPVPALVMLAGHGSEAGPAVARRRGAQRGGPGVGRGQAGRDPLQHPGAREVEAVEVGELAVRGVGDRLRFEPGDGAVARKPRQESAQPGGEIARRQHAAHQVRLGEARREEVLPGYRGG